jgi:serine/threonine-protein kinase
MPELARVDELLLQWEAAYECGTPQRAEELCPDWPEGLAELRRRIGWLQRLAPLLSLDDVEPSAPGVEVESAAPVIPNYEILDELDHGGMGIVYRARHRSLERVVAVKVMRPGLLATPQALGRFVREARVLARLRHEHIVPIHEAELQQGRPYFIMEWVPGGSLAGQLKRFQRDRNAAVLLVEQVARAVDHAHQQGILHRDLKPANILIDETGRPLVADFGLAKLVEAPAATDAPPAARQAEAGASLTADGPVPGTLPYMAPEQFQGEPGAIGPATDVWALGVILYELLTGQRPFAATGRALIAQAVRTAEPPQPREVRPGLDRPLEAIVLHCLEKQPARRYPSAAALAADLARWRRGEAPSVYPGRWASRLWRRTRRQALRAVALLLTLVLAAAYLVSTPPPSSPPGEQSKEEILADLQRELRERRAVTLVGATGHPRWFEWKSNPATPLRTRDTPFSFRAMDLSLLELLPSLPGPCFRLSAEIQYIRDVRAGEVGVYFAHGKRDTPRGIQHGFFKLGFNDRRDVARLYPTAGLKGNQMNLVCVLGYESAKERIVMQCRAMRLGTIFQPAVDAAPMPFRKIGVEVRADAVWIYWDRQQPVGPLPLTALRESADQQIANNNVPDATRPEFDLSKGLGIYVADGEAAFRNVRLELLDAAK